MRKRLTLLVATLVSLLVLAPPAAGHHGGACVVANDPTEPGQSEFAKQHIVPRAQSENPLFRLGQGHKPGHHKGFSECAHQQHGP